MLQIKKFFLFFATIFFSHLDTLRRVFFLYRMYFPIKQKKNLKVPISLSDSLFKIFFILSSYFMFIVNAIHNPLCYLLIEKRHYILTLKYPYILESLYYLTNHSSIMPFHLLNLRLLNMPHAWLFFHPLH